MTKRVEIVGADPEGSIYNSPEVRPYLIEGVGEDFWPTAFDATLVDRWITVSDREAFLAARRLGREEGIIIGGSGGMALHAAMQVCRELPADRNVLVIIPDGGRPYLSKFWDDAWMIAHGFLDRGGSVPTVAELLRAKAAEGAEVPAFVAVTGSQRVGQAISLLQRYGISQMPVIRDLNGTALDLGGVIGSIHERDLLDRVFKDGDALNAEIATVMAPPLGVVRAGDSVDAVFGDLQERPAVLVADGVVPVGVLTRSDLLEYLAASR
jgi:cystathionine beta-synthase